MHVRDATLDDMPASMSIYNELIEATTFTWTERPQSVDERIAWLETMRRRAFPVVVAVEGDALLGVASYGDFRDSVKWPGYRFTVEHSVHVAGDAWGRGVGQQLMESLFGHATRAGVHAMIGAIDASNGRSLAFHERLGFREVARMPETGWKHGHWCDLVLVQRFIATR